MDARLARVWVRLNPAEWVHRISAPTCPEAEFPFARNASFGAAASVATSEALWRLCPVPGGAGVGPSSRAP